MAFGQGWDTNISRAYLKGTSNLWKWKRDERNKSLRKLRIVENLLSSKDGVVLPMRLKAGNSHLESAVQQLHPSQLQRDRKDNCISWGTMIQDKSDISFETRCSCYCRYRDKRTSHWQKRYIASRITIDLLRMSSGGRVSKM